MSDFRTQGTTPQDARIIAEWVRQIRPTWDTPGIMAALRQRADSTPARLALAALACAASREAKYPNVIAMDGAHWRVGEDATPADRHPSHITPNEMCWDCSKAESVHPYPSCRRFVSMTEGAGVALDELAIADARTEALRALAAGRDGYRTTTTHQRKDTP